MAEKTGLEARVEQLEAALELLVRQVKKGEEKREKEITTLYRYFQGTGLLRPE